MLPPSDSETTETALAVPVRTRTPPSASMILDATTITLDPMAVNRLPCGVRSQLDGNVLSQCTSGAAHARGRGADHARAAARCAGAEPQHRADARAPGRKGEPPPPRQDP